MNRYSIGIALTLLLSGAAFAQTQTPKQALSQGQLNNLVQAQQAFTAAEQASNHCQVGNIGAAVRVIQGWLELSTISRTAEKAGAAEEFAGQT